MLPVLERTDAPSLCRKIPAVPACMGERRTSVTSLSFLWITTGYCVTESSFSKSLLFSLEQ